jgi:hypothetical protein
MPKIENIKNLESKLTMLAARYGKPEELAGMPSVVVGYTAKYALTVHEDLTKLHGEAYNAAYVNTYMKKGKVKHSWTSLAKAMGYHLLHKARPKKKNEQAQYLITPVRQFKQVLADIIVEAMSRGVSLVQSMFLAGLRLQRESQLIVPVETGHLRATAFTAVEKQL